MKSKRIKFILIAVALAVLAVGAGTGVLTSAGSYVPKNEVGEYNYRRSQEYIDGTGYEVHDKEIKKHKEEEDQRVEIITSEPITVIQREIGGRSTRIEGATVPEKKKPKEEKKKEKQVEEDDELPVIKTSLKNKEKVSGTTKKFTVSAKSYSGDEIDASKIVVMVNGARLLEQGAGSYRASLKKGTNKITITATDEEDKEKTVTYKIKCDPNGKQKPVGKLSVVVTAKAVGIDTVVPKKDVDIYESDQLSDVVARYFDQNQGVTGVDIGTGYYELGHVRKKGVIDEIPESIVTELSEQGIELPDDKNSLGLSTFGTGSGWLYEVNGNRPGQYMSAMDPVKGSQVEILYTLTAM